MVAYDTRDRVTTHDTTEELVVAEDLANLVEQGLVAALAVAGFGVGLLGEIINGVTPTVTGSLPGVLDQFGAFLRGTVAVAPQGQVPVPVQTGQVVPVQQAAPTPQTVQTVQNAGLFAGAPPWMPYMLGGVVILVVGAAIVAAATSEEDAQ
jgi:hypothetical protein